MSDNHLIRNHALSQSKVLAIQRLFHDNLTTTNHSACINFCPQSVSQSAMQSVSQPVSQPVSQLVSQLVDQSVNQPVSHSASRSVSQSTSQSVSQSASQSLSMSISQSVSQSVSQQINDFGQKLQISFLFVLGKKKALRQCLTIFQLENKSSQTIKY